MNFDEYQAHAGETAIYPDEVGLYYVALGLAGEAGEVANKIKKVLRDDGGRVTKEQREELEKELGDCLWYVAMMATELNTSLNFIANDNLHKLASRYNANKIQGSGDNR